jgi:hypothetical protein
MSNLNCIEILLQGVEVEWKALGSSEKVFYFQVLDIYLTSI